MREIKFRAWVINPKTNVIYGSPLLAKTEMIYDIFNLKKENIQQYIPFDTCSECFFMQYTGLKDKTGKEIYEGDIVRYYNSIFEVKMEDGAWNCAMTHQDGCEYSLITANVEIEVIGNIYENPELLGGKND